MVLAEPFEVTLTVTTVFERLGIEYLVGGSVASSVHGVPRATNDVDVVAKIGGRHVLPLVAALEAEFYIDADMIRDAIARRASFNVIHLATTRAASSATRSAARRSRRGRTTKTRCFAHDATSARLGRARVPCEPRS